MPGMLMSSTQASGANRSAAASAEGPSKHVCTRYPADSRRMPRVFAASSLSSTTSTRGVCSVFSSTGHLTVRPTEVRGSGCKPCAGCRGRPRGSARDVRRYSATAMTAAVLFDIDGTLLDSNDLHARAWVEVFRRHGHEVPVDAVRRQIGKGADKLMPVFLPEGEVKRDGEAIKKERVELFREKYLPQTKPFPEVRELFERLVADGKQVALASSATGPELKAYTDRLGIG